MPHLRGLEDHSTSERLPNHSKNVRRWLARVVHLEFGPPLLAATHLQVDNPVLRSRQGRASAAVPAHAHLAQCIARRVRLNEHALAGDAVADREIEAAERFALQYMSSVGPDVVAVSGARFAGAPSARAVW